jgi:hypothetical protein
MESLLQRVNQSGSAKSREKYQEQTRSLPDGAFGVLVIAQGEEVKDARETVDVPAFRHPRCNGNLK